MQKQKVSYVERLEHALVKVIQQPGADQNQPAGMRAVLGLLFAVSCVFPAVVATRYFLYRVGVLRRSRWAARSSPSATSPRAEPARRP